MKKKILIILHIPPPVNGAAVVGEYLMKSDTINKQFETNYINLTTSFDINNIGKGSFQKLKIILKILWSTFKAVRSTKYDLCYLTLTAKGAGFYKDFLVVSILKLFRQNIVYHFHNKGVNEFSKKGYNDLLYRFAFRNTKAILLSPKLYKDIKKYVPENRVYYCPNGIEHVPNITSTIEKKQLQGKEHQFLFLSNMMEEKGVLVLLKACQVLLLRNINFECHFIGAWADISDKFFEQNVMELNISKNVFMHGKKYDEEKLTFFDNADTFVFPTYYHNECFPLVLLEAMQFGLPIISTNEGGISDIVVDGQTGILVKQKDYLMLADKMEFLINNPDKHKKMGIEGRKRYNELFTLTIFEKSMLSVFKDAI